MNAHRLPPSRVLLVEDDFLIALSLSASIEAAGHVALGPCATVEDALRVIGEQQPDAAVLDFWLQDGTSEPIARALRRRSIPFVFLTGTPMAIPPELNDAPKLTKPCDPDQILQVVVCAGGGAGFSLRQP